MCEDLWVGSVPVLGVDNEVDALDVLQFGACCGNRSVIQRKHTYLCRSYSQRRHIYLGIINFQNTAGPLTILVVRTCPNHVIMQFNTMVDCEGGLNTPGQRLIRENHHVQEPVGVGGLDKPGPARKQPHEHGKELTLLAPQFPRQNRPWSHL